MGFRRRARRRAQSMERPARAHRTRPRRRGGGGDVLHRAVPFLHPSESFQRRGRFLPRAGPENLPHAGPSLLHDVLHLGHLPRAPSAAHADRARTRERPGRQPARVLPAQPQQGTAHLDQRWGGKPLHERAPFHPDHHRGVRQGFPWLRRRRRAGSHEDDAGRQQERRPAGIPRAWLHVHRQGAARRLPHDGIRLRRLVRVAVRQRAGQTRRGRAVRGTFPLLPQPVRPPDKIHARQDRRRSVARAVQPAERRHRRLHGRQRLAVHLGRATGPERPHPPDGR